MITIFAITIDLLLPVLASIPSCLCVLCNLWPCSAHWLSKMFMGLSPRSEMEAFPSGLAFVPDRHLGHLQVETSQAKFTVWGSFSASGWCTWGGKVHEYQSVAASSRNGLLPFPLCSVLPRPRSFSGARGKGMIEFRFTPFLKWGSWSICRGFALRLRFLDWPLAFTSLLLMLKGLKPKPKDAVSANTHNTDVALVVLDFAYLSGFIFSPLI